MSKKSDDKNVIDAPWSNIKNINMTKLIRAKILLNLIEKSGLRKRLEDDVENLSKAFTNWYIDKAGREKLVEAYLIMNSMSKLGQELYAINNTASGVNTSANNEALSINKIEIYSDENIVDAFADYYRVDPAKMLENYRKTPLYDFAEPYDSRFGMRFNKNSYATIHVKLHKEVIAQRLPEIRSGVMPRIDFGVSLSYLRTSDYSKLSDEILDVMANIKANIKTYERFVDDTITILSKHGSLYKLFEAMPKIYEVCNKGIFIKKTEIVDPKVYSNVSSFL